jgi:hypothetical protein
LDAGSVWRVSRLAAGESDREMRGARIQRLSRN